MVAGGSVDQLLEPLLSMLPAVGQASRFISAHQPRVAHDICRKDGRQSPYNPLAGQRASP
jgi:hypothetical protein